MVVGVTALQSVDRAARKALGMARNTLSALRLVPLLLVLIVTTGALDAQTHVLTPVSTSGIPGSTVSVPVLLENSEPVRGFSLGMTHSSALLTLDAIVAGSAILAANGGAGPDFFFQDTAPAGGSGGTCGAVLSLAAPLSDLLPGSGNELVVFTYTIAPTATPGAQSALLVTDDLGNPVLETIVSVAGVTRIPTTVPGLVGIDTSPVTQIQCALVDPCACEFGVTWTNGATYDAISIFEGGVLIQTLPGTATSTGVRIGATSIGGPLSSTIDVVPRLNGIEAAAVSCQVNCPDVPDPIEPAGLTCTVDSLTGDATLLWTNSQSYSAIEITFQGALDSVLNGGAESHVINLLFPGTYTLCVRALDECGVAAVDVCCTAVYEQIFDRGDANVDGAFNISDPIYSLNYLFGGGPMPCEKAADFNDTGDVNIADIVFGLQAIFGVGGQPPAPFGLCGVDPTGDGLTCGSFPLCP